MKLLKFIALFIIAIPILFSCSDNPTEVLQVMTPVFNPTGGTYAAAQNVAITCATSDVTIHYTLNGAEPDSTSAVYTTPINITATTTLKAMARKDGLTDSAVASAIYVINQSAAPVFSPVGGTYSSAQNVTITSATSGAVIHYTTNGTEPDTTSAIYTTPINVATNLTIKAIAVKTGWAISPTSTAVYVIYDQMISVPAGTFTMGRTKSSGLTEYADELPIHTVTLSAFYISKYEVKQSEWFSVMGTNPSSFTGDTSKPVEMVSFYDILAYCNKRSINEGLTPVYTISNSTNPTVWGTIPTINSTTWNAAICNWTANGYRLPTEAEWEYAARGGVSTPDYLFAGSDDVTTVSWYSVNSGDMTHPVGQKAANALGTFDMSGNVQEWVWDWYGATYYASSPSTNPTGPDTGAGHTIRGGSWEQTATASRIVFRNWGSPEKGNDRVFNSRLGFRVVRG
jgi:formylglycine-generating enzyme required for sulfatase activity